MFKLFSLIYYKKSQKTKHRNQLEKHEELCENHDYNDVEMPNEDKILKYNHGETGWPAIFAKKQFMNISRTYQYFSRTRRWKYYNNRFEGVFFKKAQSHN